MSELLKMNPNDNLSINIDNISDENAQDFAEFELTLEKEGDVLESDTFTLDIEPGHNYWVFLEPKEELKNGEYYYTLTAKATKPVEDVKKNEVLAHTQKIFAVTDNPEAAQEKPELTMSASTQDNGDIEVTGENFSMVFSQQTGGIVSLKYGDTEYLQEKPQVSFWRPLTDTDLHTGLQFENAPWLGATVGAKLLPEKFYWEQTDKLITVIFVYAYPISGGQESAVIYKVYPDGSLNVETTYGGLATMQIMPGFTLNFTLNKDLDTFKYYGYGPQENYIDTTEGLNLGVYESSVKKNFKKTERPQESGNRTGVRWAEVYNGKTGDGLKFKAANGMFEFDALPYNDLEIEAAQNCAELPKAASTVVRVGKVSGIGNGEYLEEWAKVDAGEMIHVNVTISPVKVEVAAPKPARAKKGPGRPSKKMEKPAEKPAKSAVEEKIDAQEQTLEAQRADLKEKAAARKKAEAGKTGAQRAQEKLEAVEAQEEALFNKEMKAAEAQQEVVAEVEEQDEAADAKKPAKTKEPAKKPAETAKPVPDEAKKPTEKKPAKPASKK